MAIRSLMNINFHERYYSYSHMNLKIYIIVALFIITLRATICNALLPYCNHINYTTGSAFESNLATVFNTLIEDTFQTGFNTTVYGQSPDQIYGILQCRGDATVDQCKSCSQNATTVIRQSQNCGNAIGGRIWLEMCFLRYENYSFIGQMDDILGRYPDNKGNNVSNPDVFDAALADLFRKLSAEAAYGSSWNRYASGTTNDSFFPKIYALVQCTRDISTDDCTACLSKTIKTISTSYPGNQGVQVVMTSCIVSYEIQRFFNSTRLPPSPPEAPANPPVVIPSSNSTHSNKKLTILGVVGGGLLLALLVFLFAMRRTLKSAIFRRGYGVDEQVEEETSVSQDPQIVTFKMETLMAATENFHDGNKLGEGGFGPVYKGTTEDGKEIAVKKLSLNSVQGKTEFLNEVNLVAKIQHRNLVKLLGCCAEGSERLIVYEYLVNNSLDKILFDPVKRKQLDWRKRYNIILGVARGLLYLHQDSEPRIIHRDIKASNILLDDKLNPKIADFGLAKLFPEDESYVSTRVAGTFGYMAPEYAMQGQLTVKADVYSFGVLILELVTVRKNTVYNLSPEMQILLGWAWRSYQLGNIVQMIDPVALIETCDEEQASRCIHIGLLCTQADASLRPLMSTATLMLSSNAVKLPISTKPIFMSSLDQTSSSGSGLSNSYAITSAPSLTPLT